MVVSVAEISCALATNRTVLVSDVTILLDRINETRVEIECHFQSLAATPMFHLHSLARPISDVDRRNIRSMESFSVIMQRPSPTLDLLRFQQVDDVVDQASRANVAPQDSRNAHERLTAIDPRVVQQALLRSEKIEKF